jgi:hypothetical protein
MMQFSTKSAIARQLAATKAQLSEDREHLQKVWRGLLLSENAIRQGQEAFFTSRALLERLSRAPQCSNADGQCLA